MFTEYVAGFMFDKHSSEVVLIQKTKPAWQAGKLNGVGGKIEETDDSPFEAMAREFREETGVETSPASWRKLATLNFPEGRVHFFYSHADQYISLRQTTDEEPRWYYLDEILDASRLLPNLKWLIPMALDPAKPFAVVSQA